MANPKILFLLDRIPGQLLGTVDSFGLSFAKPDATDLYYFSLSHILSKLQAQVVKAHRQTDPASDNGGPTPADIENFRFSAASLAGLDEVWLIGYNSARPRDAELTLAEKASVLDDNELAALTTFMNEGGGVFAAGDHTGLGLSLAGNVPRVRTMRKWWYPTAGPFGNEPIAPEAQQSHGRQRFDTTRPGHTDATAPTNPGVPAVWFDDQSDDVPQYIVPETGKNLCYEPFVYELNPGLLHPLLQGSGGPIFAFADHMHEGEVILPYEYNRVFDYAGQKFEEYPSGPHGQVKPQIIAWSSTNGAASVVPPSEMGVHVGDDSISPFNFFAAIGAYDGSIAGVGRVVVESTFHHCLDINLIGDPQAPAGDPKRQGFLASPQGQIILSGIEDYYNNIVSWLAPPHFAPKKWVGAVVHAIGIQPLRDVVRTPPPNSARICRRCREDRCRELPGAAVLINRGYFTLRSATPSSRLRRLDDRREITRFHRMPRPNGRYSPRPFAEWRAFGRTWGAAERPCRGWRTRCARTMNINRAQPDVLEERFQLYEEIESTCRKAIEVGKDRSEFRIGRPQPLGEAGGVAVRCRCGRESAFAYIDIRVQGDRRHLAQDRS